MARRSTLVALAAVVVIFMLVAAVPARRRLSPVSVPAQFFADEVRFTPEQVPVAELDKEDAPVVLNDQGPFAHQLPVHLTRDPMSKRQCDAVKMSTLQDVADHTSSAAGFDPAVYQFHDGRIVDQSRHSFKVADEFCSFIFVPQDAPDPSHHQNSPIEGFGPDAIHLEIRSNDIRLIPPHPDFFGTIPVSEKAKMWGAPVLYAVYSVPYVLNHPGSYQPLAEIEFKSYDWVMEDPIDLANERLTYDMLNTTVVSRSPPLEIKGDPVSRPSARCYHGNNRDYHGRWYRAAAFKRGGNQTSMNPEAHLDFAEHNTTVDEWGWTFAPDRCNIAYFSPQDHLSCLADSTIQCLGDSNSRRTFKSIIGGGIAWCQDPDERVCQCEDHFQSSFEDALFHSINASKFQDAEDRQDPTVFGRNSSIYFDYVGGLLNKKLFNPWEYFYDSAPNSPSLVADRMSRNGPIDVVHVSLLGWDMAAIKTTQEILAELPKFRKRLYAAYPPGTRFVTRLANSNCCGNINHKTRYSAPRFAIWNAMWREFWREDEEKGLVQVVDPSVLQGRTDAETKFLCPTTHFRTSHVRLEQMMWMSAVCEKTSNGAKMRDWDKSAWEGIQKKLGITS